MQSRNENSNTFFFFFLVQVVAARFRDRRSGGGARRQLRIDPPRRNHRRGRRHHPRSAEPARPVPYHASQMYARNLAAFLKNIVKNGELNIDTRRRDHARNPGRPQRRSGSSEGSGALLREWCA